ncbi:acid protease [Lojkania enalia]|uniref:Acid protease n=1 Tax=Lojkania enalia TaxID=147567 RepID=A0A9P4N115_9PLEO|nr:acid protease [Didymosphaeria enalia]
MNTSMPLKPPDPFVFAPSQSWDGNDGKWSSFIIRVGSPPQTFRVLPSTTMNEIWVPDPEGCQAPNDPPDCGQQRGVFDFQGQASSGFQNTMSSTFDLIGLYDLVPENKLPNYSGNGIYGFDTVGLQVQNSGGLELDNQIVTGIATKDFYLGILGLGPKPLNFSGFDHPQPSFMTNLRDHNMIPSVSYGYTAGQVYMIGTPKLFGSLTLGGFDKSRIASSSRNSTQFQFSADDSRVLSPKIQSISATDTLKGAVTLMSTPLVAVIDSTVPHIWLPRPVCDEFEQAFGLIYDTRTDLYLVNSSVHEALQERNPTIVFGLGIDDDPSSMARVSFPYEAFDLEASYPIYTNSSQRYFPIRRAVNESEYTLGRTFLQEAYVTVDYERKKFSVDQALYQPEMPQQEIVAILPPSDADASTPAPSPSLLIQTRGNGLGKGTIAGIAVASAVTFILACILFLLWWRRRKRILEARNRRPASSSSQFGKTIYGLYELQQQVAEVSSEKMDAELHSNALYLVSDDAVIHELDAQSLGVRPTSLKVGEDGTVRFGPTSSI